MNVFLEFRDAFHKSGQSSIDAFLEHRPEFFEVGKLAIAYCLIPYESEEALFGITGNRGGDWYQYLSEKLTASFEKFGENRLAVITFNYDRSLEHYLFTTLRNAHGRSDEECAQMLRRIPIHHVYGQLSRHPYPDQEARPYTPDRSKYKYVGYAARGITLLHDKAKPELDAAREVLKRAERICFLGFSYHPLNLERLRLQDSSGRAVFGTARRLIGDELGSVEQDLHSLLLCGNVTLTDADNLVILRQHLILG
ncbi:MAG TPA: hypothetical protein VJU77_09715 [Chthoniobacterales bacterium]|nr:hypothetical protein [Chthoniobacterales bacterium]